MEQFKILLKHEKISWYRNVALFTLFLNVAVFLYLIFYDDYRAAAIVNVSLILVYVLITNYKVKKARKGYWLDEWAFFLLGFCWLGIPNYWLVALSFLMGILFFLALKNMTFLVKRKGIERVNFPAKLFEWDLFDNVMLKDDILTLDFKNNRIIQAEIEPQQEIDEDEFNAFADKQLQLLEMRYN